VKRPASLGVLPRVFGRDLGQLDSAEEMGTGGSVEGPAGVAGIENIFAFDEISGDSMSQFPDPHDFENGCSHCECCDDWQEETIRVWDQPQVNTE